MITDAAIFKARILIVDDLAANISMVQHLLTGYGYECVDSATDSREVIPKHQATPYDLILLDLNMPHMDGFQVLESLKALVTNDYVSVLVLTAQPDHKLRALQAGAKDFLAKPFDHVEALTRIRNMLEVRLLHGRLREANEGLEMRVRLRTAELRQSHIDTIYALVRAAEHKDEDTGGHIQRISHYSRDLAASLGMSAEFCETIFYASPMHDIGKISIPDSILLKPGGFLPEEWEIMKRHAPLGARILGQSTSPLLAMAAEIACNHHERWDGGGYPLGLCAGQIPLSARVMNICDVYDALRSKRPYKPAFDHERAVEIIARGDGRTAPTHFDPAVLAAFMARQKTFGDIFAAHAD